MGQGSTKIPNNVHIVVVGGGYGGIELCNILMSAGANFTLVDSRDAFHHNVSAVRAVAVPGFSNTMLIPYEPIYGKHFKKAKMVGIGPNSNEIHVEGGEKISYDILVLATGSVGPFPCKIGHMDKKQAMEVYEAFAQKVKDSRRVVVVGGGAVGVEVAGEVATEYPDKEVTLIHNRDQLIMPNLNSSFYKKVDNALDKLHVKVIRGEKVTNLDSIEEGPATLYTDKDSSIEADLVIRSTGLTVNKEAYLEGLGHALDERGALKIKKSFQVEGLENVFAIGDCASTGDAWVSFLAITHAKVVAKNIAKLMDKQNLIEYKGHEHAFRLGISVGRNYGFGELKNGMMTPDFLIKQKKSSDLMVNAFWKIMKQKVPKQG